MHKHWAVVMAFVAIMAGFTALWTSCGDDAAADAGVADTGVSQCKGKASGEACPSGFCLDIVAGGTECQPECTTPGDACEVGGTAGACYNIGVKGKNVCLKAGDKASGEACGAFNDCRAGLACLEMCYSICAGSCDDGNCETTDYGFSVCVAYVACEDPDNNDCAEGYTCTEDLVCVAN